MDTVQTYHDFHQVKELLVGILDTLEESSLELGISDVAQTNLGRVRHIVSEDVFRVVFVGGFSRGKSTLVNALLGRNVLPAKLTPTTAVITTIQYGEVPRATIHFKSNHGGTKTVPVEELHNYVVIPRGGRTEDAFGSRIDTVIERVDIEYPLDLCHNGVQLVDSPGLEDNDTRQRITLQFLNQSDAAVVVLSCQQLLTLEEERFIKAELLSRGFEHIFYVVNFADELSGPEDEEEIMWRAEQILGDLQRVFILSGREGLRAKLVGDEAHPAYMAFSEFEQDLEKFLVNERGQHKLRSSAKLIESIIHENKKLLSIKTHLLETSSTDKLQQIRQEFDSKKEIIMDKKKKLVDELGRRGARIGDRIMLGLGEQCREIGEALLVMAAEKEEESSRGTLGKLLNRKEYQKELSKQYCAYIKNTIEQWANNNVTDIVSREVKDIKLLLDDELGVIAADIDSLRLLLNPNIDISLQAEGSGFEQIISAVGGLFVGGIGTAIAGGALGVQGAVMQLGTLLAAQAALCFIGLLNPLTALAASVGATALTLGYKGADITKAIRIEVANECREAVRQLPHSQEREIREKLFEQIDMIGEAIESGVDAAVGNLEAQLESAREEIVRGKEEALSHYHRIASEISSSEKTLDQLSGCWKGADDPGPTLEDVTSGQL